MEVCEIKLGKKTVTKINSYFSYCEVTQYNRLKVEKTTMTNRFKPKKTETILADIKNDGYYLDDLDYLGLTVSQLKGKIFGYYEWENPETNTHRYKLSRETSETIEVNHEGLSDYENGLKPIITKETYKLIKLIKFK